MYDGKAYTWFKTDKHGLPLQLAISITDDAMNSLPSGKKDDHGKKRFYSATTSPLSDNSF
jgi:hypothetical protein